MLTLDTSGILAALNGRDPHHATTVAALREGGGPFVIPVEIMAEATYMIEERLGIITLDAFLADVENGAFSSDCGEDDFPRIRGLIQRYSNFPLGYADASVIACAERHGGRVLTYDLRHFPPVAKERTIRIVGFGDE